MSRSRRVRVVLAVVTALLILGASVGILIVRSSAFHRYLLATIIRRATELTGGRVEIGEYKMHWSGLHVDLYRVALHGAESEANAPLFAAEHLGLALKLVSVWKRQLDLREIVADHPVVHLWVDAQGHSNLPSTAQPTQPVNIFDLAIARAVINQGEVYYNDREIPVDGEVSNLQAQFSRRTLKAAYDGTLSYRDGRIQFGEFNSLQHSLEANFIAEPSGLTLSSATVSSGSSRITATGRLKDYSQPVIEAGYEAALSGGDLGVLLNYRAFPSGEINSKGLVHYQSNSGQTFWDTFSAQGDVASPALSIALPQARTTLRAFSGAYRLEHGTLNATNLKAAVAGGHVDGGITVRDVAGKREVRFEGLVHEVSLAALNDALIPKPLAHTEISGRTNGTIQASWRGSMQNLQVHSDATIAAAAPPARGAAANSNQIPVNSSVHVTYDGGTGVLSLEQTYLRAPHTSVTLDGTMGKQSSIRIQVQSDDLREADLLASGIRGALGARKQNALTPPELLGLGGSASFNGQLQGTANAPRLSGRVTGKNIQYHGTSLGAIAAELEVDPASIALRHGQLQMSSRGSAQFDITAGLTNWSYEPRNPVNLKVVTNNIAVADFQRFAKLQYPVSGTLSANISIQGSEMNPAGQGTLRLSEGSAWQEPIQDLSVKFDGNGTVIHAMANLRTPAGSGSGTVTYSAHDETYDAQVDFPRLQVEQLHAVRARNIEASGIVKVSAQGRGTLKAPQFDATIEALKLQLRQQSFDGIKAHAIVAGQQANFTLDSTVSGAAIQARGTVKLDSDYDTTANFDTRAIELAPLLGSYLHGRAGDVTGQTELHGSLKGPLKFPERIDASINIPRISLSYQSVQLANSAPIQIDYRGGVLSVNRAELKGIGTDLQLQGSATITGDGSLRATATGTVDLRVVRLLNPDIESTGVAKLDISAQGTRARPDIRGSVHIIEGTFQMPDAPLGAEKVNAEFEVQNGRVNIKNFKAESGGGTVDIQGFATYQPTVQFNIVLESRGVRVRYPEGVRAVLASNLTLNGTPDSSVLSGQALINRVSFTDAFDLATFAKQFTGPSSPPSEGIAEKIRLNIALKSTREMELSSAKLNVAGTADLQVRGTVAEPVLIGRTNITSGELFFNGRRYEIQSGVIQFANPVRTEPTVNFVVNTTVNQFDLNVRLVGPPDRMRTTYESDPPLPPVDVINLLLTGHTTEAASATTSTPQSLLAGQMAGQVSNRVEKLVGVSSLTLDPQIGGSGTNPGARLAVQQRITKNLFFTFATDVISTQGELFQIEYQVTRRYSVSALRDQNGGYSVQVKVRKKF